MLCLNENMWTVFQTILHFQTLKHLVPAVHSAKMDLNIDLRPFDSFLSFFSAQTRFL